jgi:hypothetical protein
MLVESFMVQSFASSMEIIVRWYIGAECFRSLMATDVVWGSNSICVVRVVPSETSQRDRRGPSSWKEYVCKRLAKLKIHLGSKSFVAVNRITAVNLLQYWYPPPTTSSWPRPA